MPFLHARGWTALLAVTLVAANASPRPGPRAPSPSSASQPTDWPVYGGDPGGSRYSPLDMIHRGNVARLAVAWTYRTGEQSPAFATREEPQLEATPIVVDGTMYLSTPLGRVIALDPATGAERWVFDSRVPRDEGYGDFANRGVSTWLDDDAPPGATCRRRIYVGTVDARLVALDGATGRPCGDFGTGGAVDLRSGLAIAPFEFPAYEVTSPPVVIGDLVITGSAIADNSRTAPASGEVRAFDARTGALRWHWDPIPRDPADPAYAAWEGPRAHQTGGANVWSVMVADPARDLVFAPTSSPAPDYYGGERLGRNDYGNAIVALRASTGEVVWHFQTVHHDLWDYDNASPPAAVTLRRGGDSLPAVLQATKTGQLFVLHRDTGEPLFPVEERPVPASDVPGERAWPTQPFSAIAPLSPHTIAPDDAWGVTPEDRAACRALIAELRHDGIFTPPSLRGTLALPSNIGGAHWGGVAFDPTRQIAVIPVNRIASMVQLIPAEGFDRRAAEQESERLGLGYEYNVMVGTPYAMRRRFLRGPSEAFCSPPPWGALVAVSLETGEHVWDVPLGTIPPVNEATGDARAFGSPNLGGPIVTAGGLVFIAATIDRRVRAFDIETGDVLWDAPLPAGGRATPMTYRLDGGRQFVVVAAGGGGAFGAGDHLVAFAVR